MRNLGFYLIWVCWLGLSACQAEPPVVQAINDPQRAAVVAGAMQQIGKTLSYNAAYVKIPYPGGDVPLKTGVCTDVVIRALRNADVDLQVLVHQDMRRAFSQYPQIWGLKGPDRNIDHRRVPNLQRFFTRKGKAEAITLNPQDYQPADIIAWRLPSGLLHVGVVSNFYEPSSGRPLIIHNIGVGAQLEDRLFEFKIVGHYRFF